MTQFSGQVFLEFFCYFYGILLFSDFQIFVSLNLRMFLNIIHFAQFFPLHRWLISDASSAEHTFTAGMFATHCAKLNWKAPKLGFFFRAPRRKAKKDVIMRLTQLIACQHCWWAFFSPLRHKAWKGKKKEMHCLHHLMSDQQGVLQPNVRNDSNLSSWASDGNGEMKNWSWKYQSCEEKLLTGLNELKLLKSNSEIAKRSLKWDEASRQGRNRFQTHFPCLMMWSAKGPMKRRRLWWRKVLAVEKASKFEVFHARFVVSVASQAEEIADFMMFEQLSDWKYISVGK